MPDSTLKIFLVAGEASADMHGAHLLREIKKLSGAPCQSFGVGGSMLRDEGMEILVEAESLNIIGISAVIQRLPELLGFATKLIQRCEEDRPDLAILIDLPDFNLRMAKKLKRLGIPVLYYISPQVWAWRRYRIKKIKKYVDQMLVLFPFEEKFYRDYGVPASFVGHPLLDLVPTRGADREVSQRRRAPRIAVLPGSRLSEIDHHHALLMEVVGRLSMRYPALEVRIPVASTLSLEHLQRLFSHPQVSIEKNGAYEILAWADAAMVASGTATLEAALVGTPFLLFYRVSALHAFLFRRVVRWQGPLGISNLLLGRGVTPEFFQERASADRLEDECVKIIEDGPYRQDMIDSLRACRAKLGTEGASARAAQEVWALLSAKRKVDAT